jgi:hypothetical protein
MWNEILCGLGWYLLPQIGRGHPTWNGAEKVILRCLILCP